VILLAEWQIIVHSDRLNVMAQASKMHMIINGVLWQSIVLHVKGTLKKCLESRTLYTLVELLIICVTAWNIIEYDSESRE